MTKAVDVSNVTHKRNGVTVLQDICLSATKGERVAILGPSGAGKSTLLELLDRRQLPNEGSVRVLGKSAENGDAISRDDHADVGFVFQEFALIDRLSVYQNVLNGRLGRTKRWQSWWGQFDPLDHLITSRALADVDLSSFANKRADELSGGQRQRVAVARCLVQQPKLILADEPVSNLDPFKAANLLELITSQAKDNNTCIVFSSHQPELALRFSDRVIGLRDGVILFDRKSTGIGQNDIAQLYEGNRAEPNLRLVNS